ncbi:unnamed protein product [Ilex paraguariensis]|uniref:Membrane-bound transcription factor PTM chromo domain-containing protein n=1 Tax=Ilex paraguariensis TaxID=185542 RepID=A0ABC8S2M2_9AQUA
MHPGVLTNGQGESVKNVLGYSVNWCRAADMNFEENIRSVALSADWVKLVDNWSVESSATQIIASSVVSTQKHRPGRRGRKPSSMFEVTTDYCPDILTDFHWWRGGMLSKLIIQKGTLPHSVVKKAARQGGCRKITGIVYADDSEIPKRSRQLVWRAAVELSRTASQLALQVRYLDLHLRWSDLVRPEHNLQDGKGQESEASAFRNAFICDKKIMENKIRYGIAFGNQKHLPSRVMKSITEVEQNHDGMEKYWFFETCIPLYLIKEYEEKMENISLPVIDKSTSVLSQMQKRQLKASRTDIFSYLSRKRDNLDICCCVSCQLDVLLGNAVKCSACQGYCHEQCTASCTVFRNEEVEFLITCNQCYHTKALSQTENNNESPTSPLFLQGQEFHSAVTVTRGRQVGYSRPLASVGTSELSSEMKSSTQDSSITKNRHKLCSWGLRWKKKNVEDTGLDFRSKNILFKGSPGKNWLKPTCHLCNQPYNSDLMYICCETCTNWYHAEAVELEESKISEVVGFKCCRCRRIRSPACPYNPNSKKVSEGKKPRTRAPKQLVPGVNVVSGVFSEQLKEREHIPMLTTKEEVVYVPDDDPLLSLSRFEQFTEHNSKADSEWNAAAIYGGPQKLPIRRHVKREKNLDCSLENNDFKDEVATPFDGNLLNLADESSSPCVEWDMSTNGFEDNMMFDYECLNDENMEFEPQTYFYFTELLASDDGVKMNGVDQSGSVAGNLEDLSALSRDGISDATYGQQEPSVSLESAVGMVPCKNCSFTEPCPDLCCQICGLWIHSQCCQGVELLPWEHGWTCGDCHYRH